jgi:hypothetical protein
MLKKHPRRKPSRSCRCTTCKQIARIRKLNDALNSQIRKAGYADKRLYDVSAFWSLPTNDTSKTIGLGGYVCLWLVFHNRNGAVQKVESLCMAPVSVAERYVEQGSFLSQVAEILTPNPVVPS